MPEIRKVLSTVTYTGSDLERFRSIIAPSELVILDSDDEAGILREIEDADVAVLRSDLDEKYYRHGHLKWIHCDHAGLNKSARPEVFEKGILLTGAAGRSSPALAEHCLFFMLNFCYHVRDFLQAQKEHRWGVENQQSFRGLYGKTVGIIGLGHTGMDLVRRVDALGMDIIGYDRRDLSDVKELKLGLSSSKGDTIEPLLRQSDFVVLCIQLSDQTHHMISDAQFDMMKNTACLVNMARGSVVDEAALIRALKAGKIAGAGLDVFEQEPLPASSELWDLPNVMMTPHVTPQVPHRAGRCLDILEENVRRYRNNEPLINQIKAEDVWTKCAVKP